MKCASSMLLLSAFALALLPIATADAAPDTVFHLSIVKQMFEPDTLTIPAGQTVKIMVKNEDSLPAEFEGRDFHAEVVIPGKTELPVYVRSLEPGTYHFFNDFHPAGKGTLIVKKAVQ
jgi:plastocyanin